MPVQSNGTSLVAAVLGAIALASGSIVAQEMPSEIGPTPIRFASGNLSVSEFMAYWGTAVAGATSGATAEQNALLKRCSVRSMCDYLTWALIERERGRWDWSLYEANQKTLARDGIGYNIFAWLHFPPKWFADDPRFIRYTDLATGKTIPQLSLWAPYTVELYDEFYRRLAAEFGGGRIDFIRLAMPSEYGEIGYCAGMTKWLRPQPDAVPSYWCGDAAALEDFRRVSLGAQGSLDALNRRWGTTFAAVSEIAPPDVRQPMDSRRKAGPERNQWLDFASWYNQSWTEFMTRAVKTVRTHFPSHEIVISLGYGAEDLRYGNDQSRHIAAMAKLKVAAQTPGDVGYFATRRVSSACRAYGVPYFTEPPGDVPRERQVTRIWMDASNGTQTWFDYPPNLDRARDIFAKYKQYLTGERPVCHVALWLPTLDHYLHPGDGWPSAVSSLAGELRDLTDYEVVDDRLISDGALQTLGIRLLVVADARLVQREALDRALAWVREGGVLVVFAQDALETDDAKLDFWERIEDRLAPREALLAGASLATLPYGDGRISAAACRDTDTRRQVDVVATLCRRLAGQGMSDLWLVDGVRDGVWMTSFAGRVLMLNTTQERRTPVVHTPGASVEVPVGPGEITGSEVKGESR